MALQVGSRLGHYDVTALIGGCLRRSLLIGQLHPYNRGGHEESHPPVHLSHEPDRWDGVRYLRV